MSEVFEVTGPQCLWFLHLLLTKVSISLIKHHPSPSITIYPHTLPLFHSYSILFFSSLIPHFPSPTLPPRPHSSHPLSSVPSSLPSHCHSNPIPISFISLSFSPIIMSSLSSYLRLPSPHPLILLRLLGTSDFEKSDF